MARQKIILTTVALLALISLYWFGPLTQKKEHAHTPPAKQEIPTYSIEDQISQLKKKLSASQVLYLGGLENKVTRGDVHTQTHQQLLELAHFWRDSARVFEPYAWYLSEAAKLENSEKSLTFAARLILENMRSENEMALRSWKADLAASLFEKALTINPGNDSLKVGLGSCYVYGHGMIGDVDKTMKGVLMLREVVSKDSNNLQAQLLLGIGGVISGQHDKAVVRLEKVLAAEPNNLEAVSWLADSYAAQGNKAKAKMYYERSKQLVNNPEYSKEVDERIRLLE